MRHFRGWTVRGRGDWWIMESGAHTEWCSGKTHRRFFFTKREAYLAATAYDVNSAQTTLVRVWAKAAPPLPGAQPDTRMIIGYAAESISAGSMLQCDLATGMVRAARS